MERRTARMLQRVRLCVRRLAGDASGNVALVAALAFPLLIVLGGSGLDLHRAHTARSSSQSAIDAAALAASSSRAQGQADLEEFVDVYLAANLDTRYLEKNPRVIVDASDPTRIDVAMEGQVKTLFMGLIGITSLAVNVTTEAERGTVEQIELVMVLDNTWSMSMTDAGGTKKIDALKASAKILVDAVLAREDGNVKVAVVPYADYVNVGTRHRGASWLSVPADYSTTTPRSCKTVSTKSQCTRGAYKSCTRYRDGVPETYDCTPQTCKTVDVTPYESCSGPSTTTYRWYGCVGSRIPGNARLNDLGAATYPGFLSTSQNCLSPVVPLTERKATITAAINGMVINVGNYKPDTYIPGGLIWGVNMLSPTQPFNEGQSYGDGNRNPRKIIVLMTDGENKMSFNSSNGRHDAFSATAKTAANQLKAVTSDTSAICAYARSQGIEIYTVALAVDSVEARNLLQSCATDTDHYFDARDSTGLAGAFADIGASIYRVRLTR